MDASVLGMRVLWASSFIAIGLIGTFGNAVLALAIFKTHSLQSKSGFLLSFLALADGGQSLFSLLSGCENVRGLITGSLLPTWVCVGFLEWPRLGFLMGGCQLLVALALDRWLLLRRPLYYLTLDTRKYLTIVIVLTILPMVHQAAVTFISLKPDYDNSLAFCFISYVVDTGLTFLIVPILLAQIVIVLGISLITMFWLESHMESASSQGSLLKRRFQSSLKAVFFIYLSTQVVSIIAQSVLFSMARDKDGAFSLLNMYVNALLNLANGISICANPFVYFIRNSEYRCAMRRVLGLQVQEPPSLPSFRMYKAPTDTETKRF